MIPKKYKRLKKLVRILLMRKDSGEAFLRLFERNALVKAVERNGDGLASISFNHLKDKFYARKFPHSDLNVLKQVVLEKEYQVIVDFILDNKRSTKELSIIDAGANVGYFSLYLKNFFPGAEIACIEPDRGNLDVLSKNLKLYIENGNVWAYLNGLGSVDNKSLVISTDFRGGSDWALTTEESTENTDLKSITISRIMAMQNWQTLDILKIDIEGGERFLFSPDADISYLSRVRLLCIEIHDEFGIREQIYQRLLAESFVILNFGETTLAINKRYV